MGSGANIEVRKLRKVGPIGNGGVPVCVTSCMVVKCNANTVVTMPTRSRHSCSFTGGFNVSVVRIVGNKSVSGRTCANSNRVMGSSFLGKCTGGGSSVRHVLRRLRGGKVNGTNIRCGVGS